MPPGDALQGRSCHTRARSSRLVPGFLQLLFRFAEEESCPNGCPLWDGPGLSDHYNDRMTRQMTATEFKAKVLGLLDDVAAGEEIEITKHGRTVARLVPAVGPHASKGRLTGIAISAADDAELFTTGATWELT